MTAVDDPPHAGDLDTHVILARPPAEASAKRIDASNLNGCRPAAI